MIVIVKGKADYLWRVWYRHQELDIAHLLIEFQLGLVMLDLVKPSSEHKVLDVWGERYACLLLYFRPCDNAFSIIRYDAVCLLHLAIPDSCYLHCPFTCASLLRLDYRRFYKIRLLRIEPVRQDQGGTQKILQNLAKFQGCGCCTPPRSCRVPWES